MAEILTSTSSLSKLVAVLQTRFAIFTAGEPDEIGFDIHSFLVAVKQSLARHDLQVEDVCLTGGAAGYVLSKGMSSLEFNDLDFVFRMGALSEGDFDTIRKCVLHCIRSLLACRLRKVRGDDKLDEINILSKRMAVEFVTKMVKVWDDRNKWSLISLGKSPRNVDLKFVSKMARNYQFSVDSFGIVVDPLLALSIKEDQQPANLGVEVRCSYGDYKDAINHLNKKLISTREPEQIRGGGLLRYCDLLTKGYRTVISKRDFQKVEQSICTRYFIDFMDVTSQIGEIGRYLCNHFQAFDARRAAFLRQLLAVIQRSSHCLMYDERRLSLLAVSSFIALERATVLRMKIARSSPALYNNNVALPAQA